MGSCGENNLLAWKLIFSSKHVFSSKQASKQLRIPASNIASKETSK